DPRRARLISEVGARVLPRAAVHVAPVDAVAEALRFDDPALVKDRSVADGHADACNRLPKRMRRSTGGNANKGDLVAGPKAMSGDAVVAQPQRVAADAFHDAAPTVLRLAVERDDGALDDRRTYAGVFDDDGGALGAVREGANLQSRPHFVAIVLPLQRRLVDPDHHSRDADDECGNGDERFGFRIPAARFRHQLELTSLITQASSTMFRFYAVRPLVALALVAGSVGAQQKQRYASLDDALRSSAILAGR